MGEAGILTQNFQIISVIIENIAILMGVGFTLTGLFQLKKYGESRTMMSQQHSIAGPLMMLLAGAMLLILPTFVGSILLAFWGTNSPLSYGGGPTGYNALIPPVLMFVRIIGVGAFIRGIVLLSRSSGQQAQQGTFGKAMIHIFAGILCIHILGTINLLEQLLGMTSN